MAFSRQLYLRKTLGGYERQKYLIDCKRPTSVPTDPYQQERELMDNSAVEA